MEPDDAIDRVLGGWRRELPGLDPAALACVGRVIVLAAHLERSVAAALAAHDLSLGQFDILATLRRHGPKGGLTPTHLLANVALSSGGMTGRLDKLEERGLVARKADPTDRRGVVVELTAKGRKVIEAAAATRFAEAEASLAPLPEADRKALTKLLRKWLAAVEAKP